MPARTEDHNDVAFTPVPVWSSVVQPVDHERVYHHAAATSSHISPDQSLTLSRFASFVAAAVSDTSVTFTASSLGGQDIVCATQAEPETVKIEHSADVQAVHNRFHLRFSPATDVEGSAGDPAAGLTVHLRPAPEHGVTLISLFLCDVYGPYEAANHLLRWILWHLTDGKDENTPSPSALNATPRLLPAQRQAVPLLHAAFEEQAHLHPENVVVDYLYRGQDKAPCRRDMTFAEMDARSSRLAEELAQAIDTLNWPPVHNHQRVVPIFLPGGPEVAVAILGVLKAGHAFCVLQLDAPQERLRDILQDLAAPMMVGMGSEKPVDDVLWMDVLDVQTWKSQIDATVVSTPISDKYTPHSDDLAYVLYTSGSTGKPKGVLISHASAALAVSSSAERHSQLPQGPRLRCFVTCPPTFDAFLLIFFTCLGLGGTLCIADWEFMLTDMEGTITEFRANATFIISSMAVLLRPSRMPTLKFMMVGGELVNQRVMVNFGPHPGHLETQDRALFQGYGPTETTMIATSELCTSESRGSVVGQPLPTMSAFILDPESNSRKELPLGQPGELVLGGPQLSLGYLNRPEETAKAFIMSPTYGPLYRTGDRARIVWTPDGQPRIDFLGRLGTDQVKLNGRRVELTEIENVLAKVDEIASVAVCVSAGTRLVACVVPWPQLASSLDDLESLCRKVAEQWLPAWMRPTTYIALDLLPRTGSGKIDRKTLAGLDAATWQGQSSIRSHSFLAQMQGMTSTETSGAKPEQELQANISQPEPSPQNHHSNGSTTVAEHQPTLSEDPGVKAISGLVYESLARALGDHVLTVDPSTTLPSLGLDSLRGVVFLQGLRERGLNGVDMGEILSAKSIQDLIQLFANQQRSHGVSITPVRQDSAYSTSAVAAVDVASIPMDDEEAWFDLPLQSKLQHFGHHTRPHCIKALGLTNADVEEVLPATNMQVRLLHLSATAASRQSPESCIGKMPQVEHLVYQVPESMDPSRLRNATEAVIRRHDCFRTVFVKATHPAAAWAQCVLAPFTPRATLRTLEIVVEEEMNTDPNSLMSEAVKSAQKAAEASIRHDRPGIVLSYIYSRRRTHCIIIWTIFHAVYDNVTLIHMIEEIAAEYHAKYPPRKLLPMRAAVELTFSIDWLDTMGYWMGRFAGIPQFHFGSTFPSHTLPPATLQAGRRIGQGEYMRSFQIRSRWSMNALAARARELEITFLSVAEAAWASVLAQTNPSSDTRDANGTLHVQFSTAAHARYDEKALACMGPTMALLLMHLPINPSAPLTNRATCQFLATQHAESAPHVQAPCPTIETAELATQRMDTALLVQALNPGDIAAPESLSLPGLYEGGNLLPAYKEIDIGFPAFMELWPSKGDRDQPMIIKCLYNVERFGYEWVSDGWAGCVVAAMEEALGRILDEPEGVFYVG